MRVTPLTQDLIAPVRDLLAAGEPYIRLRTDSDYWLYARLFSTTCPVALDNGAVLGAAIAFRSQDTPAEIYIQDVMVHPDHRQRGIARRLLDHITNQATRWGCQRLYLTSEPDNLPAHSTWMRLGFTNPAADYAHRGIWISHDFKGPGKHRAVYQRTLPETPTHSTTGNEPAATKPTR